MFQQSSYKYSKYIKTLKRYYFLKLQSYQKLLVLILVLMYLNKPSFYLCVLIMFLLLGIKITKNKLIIRIKITKRIIRLLLVILLLNVLIVFNPILVMTIELYMLPFVIVVADLIIKPTELIIKKTYQKKASLKLALINPLVIGVTGSFGKTTTKNFIYQLINQNNTVCMSRKSYNTENGISKSILEDLSYSDEIYIAELGATKSNDILKLTKVLNPDIAVITDVGMQHLESFKTIENILKTKLEIIKSKNIKVLFINADNELLNNYEYPENIKIIKVGMKNRNVDYFADDITLNLTGMSFSIKTEESVHITTNIIGIHNVINILLAYAVCEYLGIDNKLLQQNIKLLQLPSHRLEVKNINNHLVIDNSFNSNFKGFCNNIDMLEYSSNYKIIITPGIVEQSKYAKTKHIMLSRHLVNKVDLVLLIKNKNTLYMKEELERLNFKKYKIYDSFKEAYQYALKINKQSTILIENDLTDYYLNGGI